MSDKEMQALKEFRADLSSDVDGARARVRHRITRAIDEPAPKRRWLPATVTAAAAATVLVGTVGLLRPGPWADGGRQQPAEARSASHSSAEPDRSATAKPVIAESPVTLPRAEPGPLTADGLTIGAGQLLYIRGRAAGYQHELWAEPDGVIIIAIQREDEGRITVGVDEAAMHDEAAKQRATFAFEGPSVRYPTREYLASLPTNPAALRAKLSSGLGAERNDREFKVVVEWLYRAEPILTPAVRAAIVRALDTLPGTRITDGAYAFGRSVSVVEYHGDRGTEGLIVDTETGRFLGEFAAGPGLDPLSTATHWEYAVVDR